MKKWPRGVNKAEFVSLREDNTVEWLADHYNVSQRTIFNWLGFLREQDAHEEGLLSFPAALPSTLGEAPAFSSNRVIVMGDCHIPHHDRRTFELCVKLAKKYGIKDLVLNGDYVDNAMFSSWARQKALAITFEEEMDIAVESLRVFLRTFERIYMVTGNHEGWLNKKIEGQISMRNFFGKLSNGVEFTEFAHVVLNPGKDQTLICHPKNYRQPPLSLPRRLLAKFHCNLLVGHTHHACVGFDDSGQYWIAEGGCACLDPDWKRVIIDTHPAWHGAVFIILDNQPYMITPQNLHFYLDGITYKG